MAATRRYRRDTSKLPTAAPKHRRHYSRPALGIVVLACLASCSAPSATPQGDGAKLVFATLQLLTADGSQICVDSGTTGQPLSVYRTMASNPPGGIKPIWFVPATLKPPPELSNADLYRGAQAEGPAHIDQPGNATAVLPSKAQAELDRAAWILSQRDPDPSVTIPGTWGLNGVQSRWWLRNRVSRRCAPNYKLSNPVTVNNIGFISVTAGHWGTTYAFTRKDKDWVVRAQWSNWLY
ncbi:hypothetical protein BH11PSE5_BH11PSE5_10780 [soil metagenome]